MASGGRVGFETVAWFNGGLFDDGAALPLERSDIEAVLAASDLDWSEIDPSILGTLFERGLDPSKRAQLGAHYTDREKILQLVEPVVVRPLLAEWEREKTAVAAELERAEARSRAARMKRRNDAERRYRTFLTRLRGFTVTSIRRAAQGNFPLPGAAGAQEAALDIQRSFLGGKLLITHLGEDYVSRMFETYAGRGAGGGGPGLLLVREGGPADRRGEGGAGRAGRDELDPGRCEPVGAAGGDRHAAGLRGMERRAVGDRRGGGAGCRWSASHGPTTSSCPALVSTGSPSTRSTRDPASASATTSAGPADRPAERGAHEPPTRIRCGTGATVCLSDKPVSEITSADLLHILAPIWHAEPETARRVRQRIGAGEHPFGDEDHRHTDATRRQ